MLAADVEEKRALLRAQLPTAPAIGARPRRQRRQPAMPIGVVPPLEGRHRVPAGELGAWWAERGLGQRAQLGAQRAVVELAARERADDLAAKQRDSLGVVLGREWILGRHGGPFRAAWP